MSYGEKFENELKNAIESLNLSGEFKSHSAFNDLLSKIEGYFPNVSNWVSVYKNKKDDAIEIHYVPELGESYEMKITSSNPNDLHCVMVTDHKSQYDNERNIFIKEKEGYFIKANLEDNGNFKIEEHSSSMHNVDCKSNEHVAHQSYQSYEYNPCGIMVEREGVRLEPGIVAQNIDNVKIGNITFLTQFNSSILDRSTEQKWSLTREYLDVARYMYHDYKNDKSFSTKVPLNREHGLKEMSLLIGDPTEWPIYSLTSEQIENMIESEKDPLIREGLRKFASGREEFNYDPTMNQNLYKNSGYGGTSR